MVCVTCNKFMIRVMNNSAEDDKKEVYRCPICGDETEIIFENSNIIEVQ